ncbi:MAG TPA: ATP-binding protein, partial [Opitutus sp.]|nr:ATP-binding protein [Opitutus sp.]
LIDDLLDVTKISHGKLELRPEPCDTDRLIHLAVEIVRPDAVAKDIVISCSLGAERSCLVADPTRFQQVIWNLLRNAVKFTPPAGRVSGRTRNQTDESDVEWLRIEVADTGIGIPVERLAEIFLPFDQGGLSGEHRFGGVGLGLAIARAVVERHGGRISARSAGRNRGATLVVELPGPTAAPRETAAPPRPRAGEREDSVPQTNSPRARLLLVDDHAPTLQALRALLCRDGYHVVTAMTAGQATAAAAAAPLDLVISDLDLPDGRGTDLMTKLRTLHGLRGIALTGYGADRDLLRSREAGFALHLVKPVAIAELRHAIASLLPAKIGQPNSRNGAL